MLSCGWRSRQGFASVPRSDGGPVLRINSSSFIQLPAFHCQRGREREKSPVGQVLPAMASVGATSSRLLESLSLSKGVAVLSSSACSLLAAGFWSHVQRTYSRILRLLLPITSACGWYTPYNGRPAFFAGHVVLAT